MGRSPGSTRLVAVAGGPPAPINHSRSLQRPGGEQESHVPAPACPRSLPLLWRWDWKVRPSGFRERRALRPKSPADHLLCGTGQVLNLSGPHLPRLSSTFPRSPCQAPAQDLAPSSWVFTQGRPQLVAQEAPTRCAGLSVPQAPRGQSPRPVCKGWASRPPGGQPGRVENWGTQHYGSRPAAWTWPAPRGQVLGPGPGGPHSLPSEEVTEHQLRVDLGACTDPRGQQHTGRSASDQQVTGAAGPMGAASADEVERLLRVPGLPGVARWVPPGRTSDSAFGVGNTCVGPFKGKGINQRPPRLRARSPGYSVRAQDTGGPATSTCVFWEVRLGPVAGHRVRGPGLHPRHPGGLLRPWLPWASAPWQFLLSTYYVPRTTCGRCPRPSAGIQPAACRTPAQLWPRGQLRRSKMHPLPPRPLGSAHCHREDVT